MSVTKMKPLPNAPGTLAVTILLILSISLLGSYHVYSSDGVPSDFSRNQLFARLTNSEFVPAWVILLFRLTAFLLCFYTLFCTYHDATPFIVKYFDARFTMIGVSRWTTFTVITFTMITIYFFIASSLSILWVKCIDAETVYDFSSENTLHSWVLSANSGSASGLSLQQDSVCGYSDVAESLSMACLMMMEVVYPASILVTLAVSFVLYPAAVKLGDEYSIKRCFFWPILVMHNANIVLVQSDLLFVSHPFVINHFPLVAVYGCCYFLFALFWFYRTGVFYYFFIDYRRPYAILTYLLVITVITISFFVGKFLSFLTSDDQLKIFTYPLIIVCVMSMCRLRDTLPRPVAAGMKK